VPDVDVAVIQLNREGQVMASANVLLSRDYPEGLIVPASLNQGAAAVRFRRWDIARWNGGVFKPDESLPVTAKGWTNDPPLTEDVDVVPGRSLCRSGEGALCGSRQSDQLHPAHSRAGQGHRRRDP